MTVVHRQTNEQYKATLERVAITTPHKHRITNGMYALRKLTE